MEQAKSFNSYWWEQPKEKVHETLFGIVRFLTQNQTYKREMNLRHMRLYGNANTLGLSAYNYAQNPVTNNQDKLTLNIIQSCCDTATQKIAKNKPKPTFLTSDGNYHLKKKAQKLSKFVLGQFYETKLYEKAPFIFRNGTVFGTGAGKIFRVGGEIRVEPTFIDELIMDDAEAIYGEPQSLYQTKFVAREVMARVWPEFKDKIKYAPKATGSTPQNTSLSDMIMVLEAWHLASKTPEGKLIPGKHVICIENQTLEFEDYKREYFPFIFSHWNKKLLGFMAQGLAEQLTGLQVEINKLLRTIQQAFNLCVPKMMIQNGNKVVMAHLNNEVGSVIKFEGQAPAWSTAAPVHPSYFTHLQNLYSKAYEISGISQLSANAQKPAGLDSGKALREFNDIESERFVLVGQAYEQMFMDAARQFLDLGKEINEEMKAKDKDGKGYKVKVHDRKFMESISWDEVEMSEDEYVMQIFPTSLLSSTPSGRLQDVQELMQAGLIDPTHGMDLLDFPDLDSYRNRKLAPLHRIQDIIERMIDKGEYSAPEPYEDLTLAAPEFLMAYAQAQNDGVEEDRLELLRRWMEQAHAMTQSAQPQPQAAAAPQAVPQAPPTSGLLPNAPAAGPMQ